MENASEALIMAGSVLLLIIALTVSISSFSNLRLQVADILNQRDQVQIAKTDGNDYINFIRNDNEDVRTVRTEAILSALRRMRNENYTIYIVGDFLNMNDLSVITEESGLILSVEEKNKNKNKQQKYGNQNLFDNSKTIIRLAMDKDDKIYYSKNSKTKEKEQKLNKELLDDLYKITNNNLFKEYIGIYQDKTDEGVSQENKQTYKIITFVKQ